MRLIVCTNAPECAAVYREETDTASSMHKPKKQTCTTLRRFSNIIVGMLDVFWKGPVYNINRASPKVTALLIMRGGGAGNFLDPR